MSEKVDFDLQTLDKDTVFEYNKVLCKVVIVENEKRIKPLGDFSIKSIAHDSDKRYLIEMDGKRMVSELGFTSSLNGFKDFIRPANFLGNSIDLENVVGFMNQDIRHSKDYKLISIINRVGKFVSKTNPYIIWVFDEHLLITHKNNVPLSSPVVLPLVEGEALEYEGYYIYVDHKGVNRSLRPIYKEPEKDYTLQEFYEQWMRQLNNKTLLYALLGWIISSIYFEQVNKWCNRTNFPFFIITAETKSGKTAFLANAIKLLGFSYTGENYTSVSPFVEQVQCGQVGNMPIWRDEYRNKGYALVKEQLLRSIYDRSEQTKGLPNLGTATFPLLATLLLSGEDMSEDPAVIRRFIKFRLKREDKIPESDHDICTYIADNYFSMALPLILKKGMDEKIFKSLMKKELKTKNANAFELMCYAAVGSVLGEEVGLQAIATANEYNAGIEGDVMSEQQSASDYFFELLLGALIQNKNFEPSLNNTVPPAWEMFAMANDDKRFYMRFQLCYQFLSTRKSKEVELFSQKAVGQAITENFDCKKQSLRLHGNTCSVFSFTVTDKIKSAALNEIIERTKAMERVNSSLEKINI